MHEVIKLDNGVTILYEHIDHVRSAAVGIWVGGGSRIEPKNLCGISHFIEHMVFKGTSTRTASDIAEEMDRIGGMINAYTAKECTCFHARALDTHLNVALDVLCDIFFNPKISQEDLELERGVILEEINMYEDSPEDLVVDRLVSAIYKDAPLGRPILGYATTLKKMNSKTLKKFMERHYLPQNTVVALCGSFNNEHIDYLVKKFSAIPRKASVELLKAEYAPAFTVRRKPTEQNHICIAFPSLPLGHKDVYALQILNNVLGGGMSSRLFQSVREKLGLCYSVYSFLSSKTDTGIMGIYTALSSKTEAQAINAILTELKKLREGGITQDELDRSREQIKSGLIMSLENTNSITSHLGRSQLLLGEVISTEETISRLDSVTLEDVYNIAQLVIDLDKMSLSAVGQVGSASYYKKLFNK